MCPMQPDYMQHVGTDPLSSTLGVLLPQLHVPSLLIRILHAESGGPACVASHFQPLNQRGLTSLPLK